MQQRDKLFIHGKWVSPHGSGSIDVINASTEAVMGRIPEGHARDAEDAIAAARGAFEAWANTPPAVRAGFCARSRKGCRTAPKNSRTSSPEKSACRSSSRA